MSGTTHRAESSAGALYVGLELSATEWLLVISPAPDATPQRRTVRAGDQDAIRAALQSAKARFDLPVATPVRSCYEAGRDGFWPHRLLSTLGVINLVVDSSSIEVSRRKRRAKTDRLDGQKLMRMLMRHWGGERDMWQVVHVPTRELEDARHASRGLTTLQAERTRYRNRIHSLLALHRVRLVIDRQFPKRLAAARDWAGEPLPQGVQARALETWRLLQAVEEERQRANRAERQATRQRRDGEPTMVQRLVQLRAIAARSATVLANELFNRGLRNRREVGALTGLVSMPSQSGKRQIDQGLAGSGLPAVRRIAVEIAWAWVRYQPESALTQWYRRRFGGNVAARRIGIVALARRVIIALWRYIENGVMPEGAKLKTVYATE
jgi:transposase